MPCFILLGSRNEKDLENTRKSSRLLSSRQGKHINNVAISKPKNNTKRKRSDLGSGIELEKISKKLKKMKSKFMIKINFSKLKYIK